jgi:hypothetical protein
LDKSAADVVADLILGTEKLGSSDLHGGPT